MAVTSSHSNSYQISPREDEEIRDEDSCSYIYGDEDAEHHDLPVYESPKVSPQRGYKNGLPNGVSHDHDDTGTFSDLELGAHLDTKVVTNGVDAIEEEEEGVDLDETLDDEELECRARSGSGSASDSTLSVDLDSEIVDKIEIVMTDMEDSDTSVGRAGAHNAPGSGVVEKKD